MKQRQAALLVRSVLALGRRLRAERPAGSAGLAAIGVLATLYRGGNLSAKQLAAEQRLQPQSLTRILAELETNGWIRRRRSASDRRETAIALSARGRKLLIEDLRARGKWLGKAMAGALTEAEREALLGAATAMRKLAAYEDAESGRATPRAAR